ncbi:hypothetical protein PFISCL1PPCAC_4557, partial [Pristionchus fissidentatus]
VFISPETEATILILQRTKFTLSIFLNGFATFCLLKQTPDMQSQFKNFLLYMQILAFVNDVFFDFAVEPFLLLPIMGGYCRGIFCRWIDIQRALALLMFLLLQVGCTCIICISYRHQAIVGSQMKIGNVGN